MKIPSYIAARYLLQRPQVWSCLELLPVPVTCLRVVVALITERNGWKLWLIGIGQAHGRFRRFKEWALMVPALVDHVLGFTFFSFYTFLCVVKPNLVVPCWPLNSTSCYTPESGRASFFGLMLKNVLSISRS